MYRGDSFFTLPVGGQAGLAILSLGLAAAMIWLTWRLTRQRHAAWRIAIWAVLFVLYLWLSPQVFYTYYLIILDGLPVQFVIGPWPEPQTVWREIFPDKRSLASDARCILGLLMLGAALIAGLDSRHARFHEQGKRDQAGRDP